MTDTMTADERKFFSIVMALGTTIKQLGSIPSGYLYAHVMSKLSFEEYTRAIDVLVRGKAITNKGHLLTWIGGDK